MEEQIYSTPDRYDLEHSTAEPDVAFFRSLLRDRRPARVLELACGNGRVTLPLAQELSQWKGHITGLDSNLQMLDAGRKKAFETDKCHVTWVAGDMRTWLADERFELVVCPCSSLSHLLKLEDQIATWRTAWKNLSPGGCFVVAEQMANLPVLAESQQSPPRAVLEIDSDTSRSNGREAERLVRYRATRYFAHEQRASVRFLYDRLRDESEVAERFLSDYESHIFYPRELQLLFLLTGFSIEFIFGSYDRAPLRPSSAVMVVAGRKPKDDAPTRS